jgi:phosphatidylglycerophosphatase A
MNARFLVQHPARWIALGFGSGLAPWAPGTVGTLWGWLAFVMVEPWLDDMEWLLLIEAAILLGWWACTRTAQHLKVADPSSIVWDEIVAFWIILLMIRPAGLLEQTLAFVAFRFFDAVKPQPVRWADQLFKARSDTPIGWLQGWGILFDDLVAAFCVLMLWAVWRFW